MNVPGSDLITRTKTVCAEKLSVSFFPGEPAMASGSEPERDWAFTLEYEYYNLPHSLHGGDSKAPMKTSFVTGHFDQPSSMPATEL